MPTRYSGATMRASTDPPEHKAKLPAATIFMAFLRLGLTAFGGPVAHLAYFREALVQRRGWLAEAAYADLVALCHFLPGPTSSQVGLGIGLARGGLSGALAAWAGFTLPSALAMVAFGYGVVSLGEAMPAGVLRGLKLVAVAVVAQAVWGMARSLCPDWPRRALALLAAGAMLLLSLPQLAIAVMLAGGIIGRLALPAPAVEGGAPFTVSIARPLALAALAVFVLLLAGLPLAVLALDGPVLAQVDAFFRVGSLVFGGGHVVLPLLEAEVVPAGLVGEDAFLAGYGAVQAVPGPLFTFAAYLGTVMREGASGAAGALLCLLAIYAPSFLLLPGLLPFWSHLARQAGVRRALLGVNAAVVGVLLAALVDPVFAGAVHGAADLAMAVAAFGLLVVARMPAWLLVLLAAGAGALAG